MIAFIVKRLAFAILIMVGASLFSFLLLNLAPGNAAKAVLSSERADDPLVDEVEFFASQHGLDSPVPVRLARWMGMLARGDLGVSLRTKEPVVREFMDRFPATALLAVTSMLAAVVIALPLGILSAVRQHSLLDHGARLAALWGVSMPDFWLGLVLILFFGVKLGWLPTYGFGQPEHLVLPALTLGTGMTALLMRLQRSSMLEVMGEEYIRTARAKGLSEWRVISRHAFRNTLIPIVTIIGMQFAHLISGVVIVEQVFSWPGIGHFLVDSIYARDYPVIQGFVLIIAFFFIVSNLMVDVLYAVFDPRIRYDKRGGYGGV